MTMITTGFNEWCSDEGVTCWCQCERQSRAGHWLRRWLLWGDHAWIMLHMYIVQCTMYIEHTIVLQSVQQYFQYSQYSSTLITEVITGLDYCEAITPKLYCTCILHNVYWTYTTIVSQSYYHTILISYHFALHLCRALTFSRAYTTSQTTITLTGTALIKRTIAIILSHYFTLHLWCR